MDVNEIKVSGVGDGEGFDYSDCGKPVLTVSRMTARQKCTLKEYMRYQLLLESLGDEGNYIWIGSVVHKFIELLYIHQWTEKTLLAQARSYLDNGVMRGWFANVSREIYEDSRSIILALLSGYHSHFFMKDEGFITVIPESEFALDFGDFIFAGKIDGKVRKAAGYYLHEIKTRSSWTQRDTDRLAIDDQVSGYLLAEWVLSGFPVKGCVYTVLKKSGTTRNLVKEVTIIDKTTNLPYSLERFDKVTPAREAIKGYKKQMKAEEIAEVDIDVNVIERRETAQEYEARLIADYKARPEFYFTREVVTRTTDQLLEFYRKLKVVAKQIKSQSGAEVIKEPGDHCDYCDFFDYCKAPNSKTANEIMTYMLRPRKKAHSELDGVQIVKVDTSKIIGWRE